jgi:hypothetical protein
MELKRLPQTVAAPRIITPPPLREISNTRKRSRLAGSFGTRLFFNRLLPFSAVSPRRVSLSNGKREFRNPCSHKPRQKIVSRTSEVPLMRSKLILALLAATAPTAAAHADFVITSPPAPPEPSLVSRAPAAAKPAAPRLRFAYGFGKRIPLSFAVRQIVPSTINVTYGPGADPDARVDWAGGQAWNRALLGAVKPLGLRLVITDTKVEIRKIAPFADRSARLLPEAGGSKHAEPRTERGHGMAD